MKTPPLFVFFGTPRFAVYVLDALETNGYLPALIVCAPDKPRGRALAVTPAPTKEWALERDIDVVTPVSLRDEHFLSELSNTPWDVGVVAAYGSLIPQSILNIPKRGCLNVHPSLLPKLRGPSPIISAILQDCRQTGVSIMQMDAQMDHGPVVSQARVELEEEAWPPKSLLFEELLATEGGNLLAETLPLWLAGEITPEIQDETAATYTKKFTAEDADIDLAGDPQEQLRKIRAFDNGPRAHIFAQGSSGTRMRVIITEARVVDGTLQIMKVIPEEKREMDYESFLRSGVTVVS